LALACTIEGFVVPGAVTLPALVLGGSAGALLGAGFGAVQGRLARWSVKRQRIAWSLAAAVGGLGVALQLDALAKLRGPHAALALLTLFGGVVGGGALGAWLSLVQPALDQRLPSLSRPSWRAGYVGCAVLALLASEIILGQVTVLKAYPVAQAMVVGSTWLVVGAASLVWVPRATRWLQATTYAALAVGLGLTARISPEAASLLFERPHAGHVLQLARLVTDLDRDGASGFFAGQDCAPFDARVSPLAPEIPANGLDDNCRFGDAPRGPERAAVPPPSGPAPRSVVLVTVDSLRADHLHAYGYARPTSPNLDLLALGARRFAHAYTSGGWTCLALHSLFSGLYPRRLAWEAVALTTKQRVLPFPYQAQLEPGEAWLSTVSALSGSPLPSLPELLRARGMRTLAVVGGEAPSRLLTHRGWLERSFERVERLENDHDLGVTERALALAAQDRERPFFLWVHYFEPHFPPQHHAEVPSFGDDVVARYDHDVAFTDFEIGRLLAGIERTSPNAVVIVTADHGEAFEGGLPTHGLDLTEELIRIPLLIRGPGCEGGVESQPVSSVDLAPTILGFTNTPAPSGLDGHDLRQPLPPQRAVLTDLWRRKPDGQLFLDATAATGHARRLVHDRLRQTWVVSSLAPAAGSQRFPIGSVPQLERALGSYLEQPNGLEEPPR
jgi:arylsulfatase A-like enzyme